MNSRNNVTCLLWCDITYHGEHLHQINKYQLRKDLVHLLNIYFIFLGNPKEKKLNFCRIYLTKRSFILSETALILLRKCNKCYSLRYNDSLG